MLGRLYQRLLALAAGPRAPLWLAVVAFAEASFFPLPPDALLIPMVIARPRAAWRLAAICTLASVAGGALGYLIGLTFYDAVAAPIIHAYGYEATFDRFRQTFADNALWVILIKGLTPIPYKIVTIACGATHVDFALFMGASLVTRGARFFLAAALLRRFGDPVRVFVERRLTLVTSLVAVSVIAGFVVLRFV